jgi:hypothetical protein
MGAPLDLDALRARLLAASGAGLAPDVRALLDAYAELRDAAAAVVAALPPWRALGAERIDGRALRHLRALNAATPAPAPALRWGGRRDAR